MAQRVNIYGFPHKGIRYGLGQLSFKVGSLIFDDREVLNSDFNQDAEITKDN